VRTIQTELCAGGNLAAQMRPRANANGALASAQTKNTGASSSSARGLMSPARGKVAPTASASAASASSSALGASAAEPTSPRIFDEASLLDVCLQIARALAFMHAHHTAHLGIPVCLFPTADCCCIGG
jgi:hypothetical protein